MELTTDVTLRGTAWSRAIDAFSPFFPARAHYMIYMLAMTIGIMYDQRIEKPDETDEDPKTVPRNVLRNQDNGKLDFIFQAAILSTTTETFSEDERLELAFGEKNSFNKLAFLTQFANYGVTKLIPLIGETTLETMENFKNFLVSSVEGRNLEIDEIPDDILFGEEIEF